MTLYNLLVYRSFLYDFNASNNGRDVLYNTDVIISIVKLIVHSHMGKLV